MSTGTVELNVNRMILKAIEQGIEDRPYAPFSQILADIGVAELVENTGEDCDKVCLVHMESSVSTLRRMIRQGSRHSE